METMLLPPRFRSSRQLPLTIGYLHQAKSTHTLETLLITNPPPGTPLSTPPCSRYSSAPRLHPNPVRGSTAPASKTWPRSTPPTPPTSSPKRALGLAPPSPTPTTPRSSPDVGNRGKADRCARRAPRRLARARASCDRSYDTGANAYRAINLLAVRLVDTHALELGTSAVLSCLGPLHVLCTHLRAGRGPVRLRGLAGVRRRGARCGALWQ